MSIIGGSSVTGADVGGPIDPRDYFNTVLYTGNGASSRAITGLGFQPDFVWTKSRSGANPHLWIDSVRGLSKYLISYSENAQGTNSTLITSFDSDGFTIGTDDLDYNNFSGETYVAWNWKANGSGVSNTDGTITSTVSANTDSGFSIVRFTGTDAVGTVGHGLGAVPKFMILKGIERNDWWGVYHVSIGNTKFLRLNTTEAAATSSTLWNNTTPTSTVFTLADQSAINPNGELSIAYVFAEISGFSKISSYTGNGSATGPSVTTDFEPTWLLIKRTDSTGDWIIHDSARDASNPRTAFLEPNTSDGEATGNDVDFNSTGFQIKSTSATVNANGGTYIYMCIA